MIKSPGGSISNPPAGAVLPAANGGTGYLTASQYGAAGNGTTDDTTALQAGIDAAATAQVPFLLDLGTYKITGPLYPRSNSQIIGRPQAARPGFGTSLRPAACAAIEIGSAQPAGKFFVGATYTIAVAGNTDFVSIGAANNNPGTAFTATGVPVLTPAYAGIFDG